MARPVFQVLQERSPACQDCRWEEAARGTRVLPRRPTSAGTPCARVWRRNPENDLRCDLAWHRRKPCRAAPLTPTISVAARAAYSSPAREPAEGDYEILLNDIVNIRHCIISITLATVACFMDTFPHKCYSTLNIELLGVFL